MNSTDGSQVAPTRAQPAQSAPTAQGNSALTDAQRHMLKEFVGEAAELSEALAADNLEGINKHLAKLPALARPLPDALAAPHPLNAALKQLAAAKLQTAKDLADARKQFLPFSTALVDLTKQLRKQDKAFADLKVYHCPMAPEPGLWIQAKGPLANPYYGSKMLRCGEEVTR